MDAQFPPYLKFWVTIKANQGYMGTMLCEGLRQHVGDQINADHLLDMLGEFAADAMWMTLCIDE